MKTTYEFKTCNTFPENEQTTVQNYEFVKGMTTH